MTLTASSQPALSFSRIPAWAWLALTVVMAQLTGPRWGAPILAWLAPVPALLFARQAKGVRAWLALFGTLALAYSLQLLSITTEPIPNVLALAFGIPVGVGAFASVALGEALRRRTGEIAGVFAFASLVALGDWLGYRHTELGAWMATANTQTRAPLIIQSASIVGLAGIGFVMAWTSAAVALLIARPTERPARWLLGAALAAVLLMLGVGALRLDYEPASRVVRVAAVTTDMGLGKEGVPSAEALAANTDALFERTALAATRGARLVVWNEAATLVQPAGEQALVARGSETARRHKIDLVLAYGVLRKMAPLEIDNVYVLFGDDGQALERYRKHHPVPGEPSLRGEDPIRVIARPYARIAGAICYDYDFPALARTHAQLGAELVFVPASDWRGIDPIHTWMAGVRAIEAGHAVVRATRWAASAAFDTRGQARGWMSAREDNERVMVAAVPVGRVRTVYAITGDTPVVVLAASVLAAVLLLAFRKRARER